MQLRPGGRGRNRVVAQVESRLEHGNQIYSQQLEVVDNDTTPMS